MFKMKKPVPALLKYRRLWKPQQSRFTLLYIIYIFLLAGLGQTAQIHYTNIHNFNFSITSNYMIMQKVMELQENKLLV